MHSLGCGLIWHMSLRTTSSPFPRFRRVLTASAICLVTAAGIFDRADAAAAGVIETFSTQDAATDWQLYDEFDGEYYAVNWVSVGLDDPYIAAPHQDDYSLTFVADEYVGSGTFVGDYLIEDVEAIAVDVFIDDLDEFSFTDCAVYTDGPVGKRFYYSKAFFREDFSDDGWWTVRYYLDDPWFYFDSVSGEYVAIVVDAKFLRNIEELDFSMNPKLGTTAKLVAAIDNVVLEPYLVVPNLATSVSAGKFSMTFTPAPVMAATVEKFLISTQEWVAVEGQSGIIGPTPYLFQTPLKAEPELFRVTVEPDLIDLVPTP